MKRLVVYLHGRPTGLLEQDASGLLTFQYNPAWLRPPGTVPLSHSLPLRPDAFRGKHARPFFAGILPDEGPRQQIAAILGVSDRNDFAMLERIGGECAGAVTLLPEGVLHPAFGETQTRELSERQLQEIILELLRRPLLAGTEGLRLSLAGSQSKLPVVVRGSTIGLPLGNTPSTHIIKPDSHRFPGLVANEAFCMRLAMAVGLNVPLVSSRLVADRPCILVQRYDRLVNEHGAVERVHQEDICQALGVPPERKYEQEGGPTLRDCITLLRDWSTVPALDIRDFLDGLIFNVLIGNADAHAKNYSILYHEGHRRLAPLYDLVCTLVWSELSKTPAMRIGKSDSMDAITPAHWQKMAEQTRVSWPRLRERVVDLSHRTLSRLQDKNVRQAANDDAMADRVAGFIERRASALAQMLQ